MNRELAELLQGAGLSETTIAVLDNEAIHNVEVFQLLHEEHVQKLLGMLPLGQHALLTELWQRSLLEANESTSLYKQGGTKKAKIQKVTTTVAPSASSRFMPTRSPKVELPNPARIKKSTNWTDTPTSLRQQTIAKKQELFKLYRKEKTSDWQASAGTSKKDVRTSTKIKIRMGGMVYCPREKRGIKRGYLPSPRETEFTKDTTYEDVLAYGRETFFSDLPEVEAAYYLADSSGVTLPSFNPGMSLRQYFWAAGTTPSKTRMYVLQRSDVKASEEVTASEQGAGDEDPADDNQGPLADQDEEVAEHLEAIKDALSEGEWTHQPLGPLVDYVCSPRAKDRIPSEALNTFIVFSVEDVGAAKEILNNAGLPIPGFGVVAYEPNEQLYTGLPPMEGHWKNTLESMPPVVANYLIDQYEVEHYYPEVKRT